MSDFRAWFMVILASGVLAGCSKSGMKVHSLSLGFSSRSDDTQSNREMARYHYAFHGQQGVVHRRLHPSGVRHGRGPQWSQSKERRERL